MARTLYVTRGRRCPSVVLTPECFKKNGQGPDTKPGKKFKETEIERLIKFVENDLGKITDCYLVEMGDDSAIYFDEKRAKEYGGKHTELVKDFRQAIRRLLDIPTKTYECEAYTDGSYKDGRYSCGIYIIHGDKSYYIQRHGEGVGQQIASTQAELFGCTTAIQFAIEQLKVKSVRINYDCNCIECWAYDRKENKGDIAVWYYDYINASKKKIDIGFRHVKAHSGVEGNETADKLAGAAYRLQESNPFENNGILTWN